MTQSRCCALSPRGSRRPALPARLTGSWGLRDYGTGTWTGGDGDCDHAAAAPSIEVEANRERAVQYKAEGRSTGQHGGWEGRARRGDGTSTCRCGAQRTDDQLGLEATPTQYVERIVEVFREVRRCLRDDGTLWLNLGDSYASDMKGSGGQSKSLLFNDSPNGPSPRRNGNDGTTPGQRFEPRRLQHGLKPKDLVGIPWKVAFALQQPYYSGRIRDERDRIWLAAILDAEGCIHIHRRKAGADTGATFTRKDGTEARYARKHDTFGVMVSIDNTSKALVDRCAELVGQGSRYTHEARTGRQQRKQTLYRLTLTGQQSRELLRELYPHLVAKQHQARIAYACPSSGDGAAAAHEAVKLLHNGSDTTVASPAPPTMFEPGYYLRSDIIWGKSNPMPESVTDRPTKAHEYLFLFSKQPRYFYDADAIREDGPTYTRKAGGYKGRDGNNASRFAGKGGFGDSDVTTTGRNARSVWTIPTEPFPEAHFATYPQALVAPCIQAGTSEHGECAECGAPWVRETDVSYDLPADGNRHRRRTIVNEGAEQPRGRNRAQGARGTSAYMDSRGEVLSRRSTTTGWAPSCSCLSTEAYEEWRSSGSVGDAPSPMMASKLITPGPIPQLVLDPFIGSGTTALVARKHGRRSIGIDLSESYLAIAAKRTQQLSLLGGSA